MFLGFSGFFECRVRSSGRWFDRGVGYRKVVGVFWGIGVVRKGFGKLECGS